MWMGGLESLKHLLSTLDFSATSEIQRQPFVVTSMPMKIGHAICRLSEIIARGANVRRQDYRESTHTMYEDEVNS